MENLGAFLEANRKDIVDFVEGNQRPMAFESNAYAKVLNELVSVFPMTKGLDKAHNELAIAILESMWCGWLSQAKANKGSYGKDDPEKFKRSILSAFEIGQQYAATRP
jgi:hypothetical protein